ncbi:SusC/RagA family TonB-linked outer membrane protein [Flavobacterium sp. JLP]|uniref:SusC/RagA family TonB-linked outer membrane protein n=1 Tax=unclassified Flavobacterium TaxID=196869 RepID=UPI00188A24DB|nr:MULTISPECIES: SusC/RagA family TonB-linked outer membrane protein [unclassified Flavobacterium]MBF4494225.1 SusC/RagA family TonB-linked outer membrane protein [Flavobacterium sp. MR2016-29]MBF4507678.1 SusC/RagA family TonB-linked outer membrane protein [Flavobacterium sp. JLP]
MKKLLYQSLLVFLTVFCYQGVNAQDKIISGTITDNANMPVPFAIIKEKGTKAQTNSDENGDFKISVNEGATIIISSIGFKTIEIKAVDGLKVKLSTDTNELDGVTVTALGQSKKNKSIGYATSIIKSDAITKTASPTIANSLYGKAPGVRVSSTPGGAGAINIQIRGLNSITGKNQPLIVLDGVPIRDGEVNNNDYWNAPRVKSNGLADINPEDIENISILKGASAAALYGSEAVNGVVLITSKSGKGKKGLGVDFSTSYSNNSIAFLPRFQYERGPGYSNPAYSTSAFLAPDGFAHYDTNGDGIADTRGVSNGSSNFGMWFDGQPIMSWDGVVRPYSAQKDGYKNLFQNAWDGTTNIALSNNTENASVRFSYTHTESEGLSMGNNNKKNTFNLNTSFKTGKNSKTDVIVSYMNQNIHNRTYAMDRLINNFTGMLSPFDNGDWYKAKYQTSLGYKYVTGTNQSLTPNENIIRNGFKADIGDYFWNINANQQDEITNRLIASLTETLTLTKDLTLRGRVSTDLTSVNTESRNPVEKPLIYGFGPGSYLIDSQDYNILYGDLLLTYNKKITEDFSLNALLGYSGSDETGKMLSRSTNGGLSVEGWYDMNSSVNTPTSTSSKYEIVKDAVFGTLNASFRNYLFVEGTIRRDRTSTMNPNNNAFTYPSVNSSFVLSDAVQLPEFISYAKMRGSWGIVGNYPDRYAANIAFSQTSLGTQGTTTPVLITTSPTKYGNEGIKPEMKTEYEFGFETKFFDRRLGLDFSYYNATVKDQILDLTLAPTTGATSILANVGELSNQGFEVAFTASPFRTEDFSWDVTLNWAKNINKIVKLANGATELLHADYDGSAAQLKSVVGDPMGGIYAHPVKTDAEGNKMVDSDGFYMIDGDKWEKYGTATPKGVGGLINSFTYKSLTLDVNIDYSYGGYLMPTGVNWMKSRGLTEETLNFSTNERGGLTYYKDANGQGVQVPNSSTSGPGGQTLYRDGMIMDGVTSSGATNTNVISQAGYYNMTYNWGGPQYSSSRYDLYIQKNNYVKVREISLAYNMPAVWASKIGASKLSFSVFGRNLFYIYRTIKDMDAEATTSGSRWSQNVNNAGLTPATRSFGAMLRASF